MERADAADVVGVLRERLAARERPAGAWADIPELRDLRASAVLVPLVCRAGEWRLVFTLRSAQLKSHTGQISFPGGKCDADEDKVATAVREADEELGIPPACVQVLGLLGDVPTPTGFLITPVVGVLDPAPMEFRPSEHEVAEVFEVALSALADPAVFQKRATVERWGRTYDLIAYVVDGRDIWGATARMVQELLALLP